MEADEIRAKETSGLGGTEVGQPACAAKPGQALPRLPGQRWASAALPGNAEVERAENVPVVGEGRAFAPANANLELATARASALWLWEGPSPSPACYPQLLTPNAGGKAGNSQGRR